MEKQSLYHMTSVFFEWAKDNYGIQKPAVTALFFTTIHIANKLRWPDHFGLPRDFAMHLMGISSRSQYYKAFDILVDQGFIDVLKKSSNQNQATIIKLSLPGDRSGRTTGNKTTEDITTYTTGSTLQKTFKDFNTIKKNKENLYDLFFSNAELQDFLAKKNINAEKKAKEFISSVLATKQNVWRDESEFFLHMKNWALKQKEKSQNEQVQIKSALRDE